MTAEHNQALLTELGTILINRPRARENPKVHGRGIGKRTADEGFVERKVLKGPDGRVEEFLIYQKDGELGTMELKETGEHHFEPLLPTRIVLNRNGAGPAPYRPYIGLKLPPDVASRVGRREITVALYQTVEDKRRGYLRTAHVRAIGPSNPDFAIYTRMRGDSESLNRWIEDSLYRHHRAHSDGAARQHSDMLGLAGLINALTRAHLRVVRLLEAA